MLVQRIIHVLLDVIRGGFLTGNLFFITEKTRLAEKVHYTIVLEAQSHQKKMGTHAQNLLARCNGWLSV